MVKMKGIKGKTVRKLYRLARELEMQNGIRVEWRSFIYEGKHCFYFEPIQNDSRHLGLGCYCTAGFGNTVREAVRNFYWDMAGILQNERSKPEERGRYDAVKADFQPGRYKRDAYPPDGRIHGKTVARTEKGFCLIKAIFVPNIAGEQ